MDITIDYGQINDYKALAEIYQNSLKAHLKDAACDTDVLISEKEANWIILDSIIADPGEKTVLVAKNSDQPVGFIVFGSRLENIGPNKVSGEIFQLYVAPEYWRCKIGKKLIDRAVELMAQQGHGSCLLWVIKRAVGTLAFYQKDGWAKLEISRPDFNQIQIERVCLQKDLISHAAYRQKQKISLYRP